MHIASWLVGIHVFSVMMAHELYYDGRAFLALLVCDGFFSVIGTIIAVKNHLWPFANVIWTISVLFSWLIARVAERDRYISWEMSDNRNSKLVSSQPYISSQCPRTTPTLATEA